jgi:hypothetical protein
VRGRTIRGAHECECLHVVRQRFNRFIFLLHNRTTWCTFAILTFTDAGNDCAKIGSHCERVGITLGGLMTNGQGGTKARLQ